MKNFGLLSSSIILSGALLLTGCSSSNGGNAADGIQPGTNGMSTENPDALPTSYENLGGAKDWNLDGSGRSSDSEGSSVVLTPTPAPNPNAPTDINAKSTPMPTIPESLENVKPAEGSEPAGFDKSKTLNAPSDSGTELKVSEPFSLSSSGFKPKSVVYAYLYFKDAEGDGDIVTNGIADDKGNVVIRGYAPTGFKTDANYILRAAGINNDGKGIFYQAPIRIVK